MFGTSAVLLSSRIVKLPKISDFLKSAWVVAFGRTDALCQGMMPQLIETRKYIPGPRCTYVQARRLLEELRAAYQSFSPAGRELVKGVISQAQRVLVVQEIE